MQIGQSTNLKLTKQSSEECDHAPSSLVLAVSYFIFCVQWSRVVSSVTVGTIDELVNLCQEFRALRIVNCAAKFLLAQLANERNEQQAQVSGTDAKESESSREEESKALQSYNKALSTSRPEVRKYIHQ